MSYIEENVRINEKKAIIKEEVFHAPFNPRGTIFKFHKKCRTLNIVP